MRKLPPIKLPLIFLFVVKLFFSLIGIANPPQDYKHSMVIQDDLKKAAFTVLDTKCNVCHRRQNPFMVFNERNMERRAGKIHHQVFVAKRMPKPEGKALTTEEKRTLKNWLLTQNID
ncbi:MAG: hypothetical protein KDC24_04915 [Saprospiraceae bacterium]|nr:hypothetical protein [Saprospiraceae bacterium]